jgi:hypothetical protein
MSNADSYQSRFYVIKVLGVLDASWMDWFNGMQLTYEETSDGSCLSVLSGVLQDQAALHGKLTKLRDLNLALVELHSCDDIAPSGKQFEGIWPE